MGIVYIVAIVVVVVVLYLVYNQPPPPLTYVSVESTEHTIKAELENNGYVYISLLASNEYSVHAYADRCHACLGYFPTMEKAKSFIEKHRRAIVYLTSKVSLNGRPFVIMGETYGGYEIQIGIIFDDVEDDEEWYPYRTKIYNGNYDKLLEEAYKLSLRKK